MLRPRTLLAGLVVCAGATGVALSVPAVASATGTTLYVSSAGTNSGDCSSSSSPCATVSYALSQASSGDTIEVAGTISDNVNDGSLNSLTIEQWPSESAAILEPQASFDSILNVSSGGSLTLDGITLEGDRGDEGGAIVDVSSTVNIDDSTISGNTSTGIAGAIYNRYGTINISDSTFSGNSARSDGGAIFNFEATLTVSNSTFSGNAVTNGLGSSIANDLGTVTIEDSTVSGHARAQIWSNGTVIFAGDIIANPLGSPPDHECWSSGGTFTDDGYNVDDDGSCGFSSANNSVSDSSTIDRYLGPLQNNGGSTDTIALLPGNASAPNPAEYTIPSSFDLPSGPAACSQPDQRAVARGTPCDMGAYSILELYALPNGTGSAPCITESATPASVCSLETAMTEADGDADDVVNLEAPDGDGHYTGVTDHGVDVTASAPMVLQTDPDPGFDDGGATLDGEGQNTVLTVTTAGNVAVSDLEIENGSAPFGSQGGGVKNAAAGTVTVAGSLLQGNGGGEGGAISNSVGGTLNVWGSTFDGNQSDGGGAIANGEHGGGTLNVSDSLFEDNQANNWGGGAILNGYGSGGSGTAAISDSTFVDNVATYDNYGGAIDNSDNGGSGTISVTESTFEENGEIDSAGSGSGTVTVAGDVFEGSCRQQSGGSWNDEGYNVSTNSSCLNAGTGDDSVGSSLYGDFGSLDDNGGPTETTLLLPGNPAIGVIPDPTSGLCPVSADQRGDASTTGEPCNAGSVQDASAQSIGSVSTPPSGASVGGATYTPSATATSGLAVAITVDASTAGNCSIAGGVVRFDEAGNCELDFNQSGDSDWDPASQVQQEFAVDATIPSTPIDAVAAAFGLIPPDSATVSWQPPSSDGGEVLSGYEVVANNLTRSESSSPDDVISSATSTQVTGLVPGDLYDFTITAVNSAGSGPLVTSNDVVPVAVSPAGDPDIASGTSVNPGSHASASVGQAGQAGSVSAMASGLGTVGVERYPSDPVGVVPVAAQFYDVSVVPGDGFDQVVFTVCGVGSGAQLEWWDPYQPQPGFQPVSEQTSESGTGSCVTVTVGAATEPSLSELVGTVIDVPTSNTTSGGDGYMATGADGGVFAYGDAGFYGSRAGHALSAPIVGIASTPNGEGYWLAAADGGVFAYGDAGFYGSRAGLPLNKPVVGMMAAPNGKGYWLVAGDGGVFSYGEATFHGSHGGSPLSAPVTGMALSPNGNGYWLVGADGGVFAYGDAVFCGRTRLPLDAPMVGITAS
jgi:predicted outer membrane repeat protein